MKKKSLAQTNKFLKDKKMREELFEKSVSSSCGVEGVKIDFKKIKPFHIKHRSEKKIYKKSD